MGRRSWIITIFSAVLLIFGGHDGAQQAYAFDGPHPGSRSGPSHLLSIIDSIPQPGAGLAGRTGVSDDTCFGVLIESRYGINPADPGSIRFTIDDGIDNVYRRDLGSDTVRVIEVAGADPQKTLLWAVYERSLETFLPPLYFPDTIVRIGVKIVDRDRNRLSGQQFRFKIESDPGHSVDFERLPDYEFIDADELIAEGDYDSGVEILSGELEGAKIVYSRNEPLTPGFGPLGEIQALDLAGAQGIGAPLNLLPHTLFNAPLKLFIPTPEGTDITGMEIYYHNGMQWLRACDSEGNLLPGGTGWMVPGSRINHIENQPPLVEIQVYHFSAAQGGFVVVSTGTNADNDHSNQSGTVVFVKCFIEAGIGEANLATGRPGMLGVLAVVVLLTIWYWYRRFKVSRQLDALDGKL